ncbi:MAG: hypothetical protein GX444_06585 [Myxococcales bacterium]|nr:hypothetical protein [Myxococcales bacterium]
MAKVSRLLLWLLLAAAGGIGLGGAQAAEEPPADDSPLSYYSRAVNHAADMARTDDRLLWGDLVERLPANTLGFRLDYLSRRYDSAYRDDGHIANPIRPLHLKDPFGGGGKFLDLRTHVNGRLETLMLQLSFGVVDNLTFYLNFPLVKQQAWLEDKFSPGTSAQVGGETAGETFRLLERLGRPMTDHRYESDWSSGDLEMGLSWIYYDTPYLLIASQGAIMAPTGRLADPGEAQRFGLGAQVDVGNGSWAPKLTQVFQFRFPKPVSWLSYWAEGSVAYYLPSSRQSPPWRKPDADLDPWLIDLRAQDDRFIDLSSSDDSYTLTPGLQVDVLAGPIFSFAYFTFGVGYVYDYRQEPMVGADSSLKKFFKANYAYLDGESHNIAAQIGFPLAWLHLPGLLNMGYRYPLGGRNELKWEDVGILQTLLVLPME